MLHIAITQATIPAIRINVKDSSKLDASTSSGGRDVLVAVIISTMPIMAKLMLAKISKNVITFI
jgi:hypothetical protein